MIDDKMLPFKVTLGDFFGKRKGNNNSRIALIIAKKLLNECFVAKQIENEGGPKFEFDRYYHSIALAITRLIIAEEIKHPEETEALMKFLAYKQRERSYT